MNPITDARIRAGLSKQEFGRRMALSRTFILRAEEGCYSNPGSKLVKFSTKTLEISISEFNRRYANFQRQARIRSTENVEPLQIINRVQAVGSRAGIPVYESAVGAFNLSSEVDLVINSSDIKVIKLHREFKKWREGYWNSYVGFCKALCVHPASVENYESGNYKAMPELIIEALSEVSLIDSSFDPHLEEVYVYA